jgi:hypothetical protein
LARACSARGPTDPTGTNGNIADDPLLVLPPDASPDGQRGTADDDLGGLHLSLGSPCIYGGDNFAVPADLAKFDNDCDISEPIRLGHLPGDVDADGVSAPPDILWLVDCLNGVLSCETWQCDVDRSGQYGPPDIARVIELLNGAGLYDPWLYRSLP